MRRYLILFSLDFVSLCFSIFLGYYLVSTKMSFSSNIDMLYASIMIIVPIKLVFYLIFELYKTLWRYATVKEMINIISAVITSSLVVLFIISVSRSLGYENHGIPILSVKMLIVASMAETLALVGSRFVLKYYRKLRRTGSVQIHENRILIIGVNNVSNIVTNYLLNNPSNKIVGYLDPKRYTNNKKVRGERVFGWLDQYEDVIKKYHVNKVIVCIDKLDKESMNKIVAGIDDEEVEIKVIKNVKSLFEDPENANKYLQEVNINDLLGRPEALLNTDEIRKFVRNKTVLVTGAGGSIGSEICRQIVNFKPEKLILLDSYETSTFEVLRELENTCNTNELNLELKLIIANIQDKTRIEQVFKENKPDIVYHAAAYKHVPLMEWNPQEAIKNNIIGSYNVASMANKYHVSDFVLISTDKAVNPTNIMGATKRFVELIIQSIQKESKTKYSMVRFGNVLGSNGSVIPIFENQIKNGGPITITDKKMIRYFMTIPEAAQLVIQSGCYANGGEVFILDMGEPVRIYDLALNMLRLKGLVPGKDIKIVETGIRPGEKMYEELLLDKDQHYKTKNEKIFVDTATLHPIDNCHQEIDYISNNIENWSEKEIYEYVMKMVPTFTTTKFK